MEVAKHVEMAGKDDKRQITAVFAGSLTGDFLPPQLAYKGKTDGCLPQYQFLESWDITFSTNYWANHEKLCGKCHMLSTRGEALSCQMIILLY